MLHIFLCIYIYNIIYSTSPFEECEVTKINIIIFTKESKYIIRNWNYV